MDDMEDMILDIPTMKVPFDKRKKVEKKNNKTEKGGPYSHSLSNLDDYSTGSNHEVTSENEMICTQEFAPVCANSNGEKKTFSNKCYADKVHANILYRGKCKEAAVKKKTEGTTEFNFSF